MGGLRVGGWFFYKSPTTGHLIDAQLADGPVGGLGGWFKGGWVVLLQVANYWAPLIGLNDQNHRRRPAIRRRTSGQGQGQGRRQRRELGVATGEAQGP